MPVEKNEVMTLVQKNANGQWVFQRNGYGAEKAIPAGPVTLYWHSIEWIVPPSATVAGDGLTAYWDPVSGCNGSSDPHGNCLIQDTNNTGGHLEMRAGGESAAVNVPAWDSLSADGWPVGYQTMVGNAPAIFSMPFANTTPNQAAGVNFSSEMPPFDGAFGNGYSFSTESHPNPGGDDAGASFAFDDTPILGGTNDPQFSLVSGQLYVSNPTNVLIRMILTEEA